MFDSTSELWLDGKHALHRGDSRRCWSKENRILPRWARYHYRCCCEYNFNATVVSSIVLMNFNRGSESILSAVSISRTLINISLAHKCIWLNRRCNIWSSLGRCSRPWWWPCWCGKRPSSHVCWYRYNQLEKLARYWTTTAFTWYEGS